MDLLRRAFELISEGQVNDALDLVNDEVDELLWSGEFDSVNDLFRRLRLFYMDECLEYLSVPISFLMIAPRSHGDKYPAREVFTSKLKERLSEIMSPDEIEAHLGGLV